MKVYGGLIFIHGKQRRTIVKAKSQKRAAELLNVSAYQFRNFWCETGNSGELDAAEKHEPETVLVGGGPTTTNVEYRPISEVEA